MSNIAHLVFHFLRHACVFGENYPHVKILPVNAFGERANHIGQTSRLDKWHTL